MGLNVLRRRTVGLGARVGRVGKGDSGALQVVARDIDRVVHGLVNQYWEEVNLNKSQWILGLLAGFAVLASVESAHAEGFELGARAGYGIPLGKAEADETVGGTTVNNDLSKGVSGMIPLQLDVGYRVIPSLMVGGYVMYGFGFLGSQISDSCDKAKAQATATGGDVSCGVHDVRLGIQLNYHFTPDASVDPWIGAGFGYEWLSLSESATVLGQTVDISGTLHGWELLNLQGGVDFSVAPKFGLGPFASFSLAQYGKTSSSCSGSACGATTTESKDITNTAMHEWLLLGIHGAFVL